MYSDYAFYTGSYNGALTEAEFSRFGVRATAEINRITSQKAKTSQGEELELVKFAECAVIDELNFQSFGGHGDVVSESNDGISRSYATGVVSKSSRQRIDAAAFTWLSDPNLLYVGL